MYIPWLILVIIAGAIICAVISSSGNNSHSNSDYTINNNSINSWQQNNEIVPDIDYSNQSDFQRQLQESTKTPQQVEDENWLKEKNEILNQVEKDYAHIKNVLLNKARSGQYSYYSNRKYISVDVYSEQLKKYISHIMNKDIIKAGGIRNQSVTYYISNNQMYNYYLSEIKKLSEKDNIVISIVFKDNKKHIEYDTLPCTVSDIIVYPQNYSLYLRCVITY